MSYFVNFHTGAGNFAARTLESAMRLADERAAFTKMDISIEDASGADVAIRRWYGVAYDPEIPEEKPIIFGDFGFYADWVRLDASESASHKAWVFYEYRDRKGTGSYEVFADKAEAMSYAKKQWDSMCDSDKNSYLTDPAGNFWVAELPVTWDDTAEQFEPDFGEYDTEWDALK